MSRKEENIIKNSILDKKIKSIDDIEEVLNVKYISVIPDSKEKGRKN